MLEDSIQEFINCYKQDKHELPETHAETINLQIALNKEGYKKESRWVGWHGAVRANDQGAIKEEAVLLHNIVSFLLPNFDIEAKREDALEAERAAEKAIPLRSILNEPFGLCWAWWDLGCARLAAKDTDGAIYALGEGLNLAERSLNEDKNDPKLKQVSLWLKLFSLRALWKSGNSGNHLRPKARKITEAIFKLDNTWDKKTLLRLSDLK
ncbi:hypothetical protein CL659_05455 [bacterium]|nr:hypothetical protein [bacterium]